MRILRKIKYTQKRIAVAFASFALTVVGVFLIPFDAYATTGWWWPDYVGYPGSATLSNVDNSYGSPIHTYSNVHPLFIVDTTGNSTYHTGTYYQAREDFYVFDGSGGETTAHGIHTDWLTNTTQNTGYHEVALNDLQSWTSLLKGNWGYVNSRAQQEYATVSAAGYGSLQVISLGHLLGAFGAYKPSNLDDMCDTYYSNNKYEVLGSPIVISDPPQGSIVADQSVVGAGQTETLSTTVKDDTWGNTSHRESVLITGPNGYSKWIYGHADDSSWQNYNAMGWHSGGGPAVSQAQVSCSSAAHAPWETWNNTYNFNTSGLADGTYTAHFYAMDWARRGSGEATASFHVDTVSLSASPTSLYINQATKFYAHWNGEVTTGQKLEVVDSTTGQVVGSGGWGSPSVTVPVTEGNATTQNYVAYLVDGSGTRMTQSSPVAVTWNWPSVYITASPSSLLTNQTSTITASVPSGTLNDSQTLVIYDETANLYYTNTGGYGQTSYTIHVKKGTASTDTYTAYIRSTTSYLSGWNNAVTVTWNWPPDTIGANPTHLSVDHDSTLTASVPSGTLNSGQRLEIVDKTTGGIVAYGGWNSTVMTTPVTQSRPTTQVYEVFITDSQGNHLAGGDATTSVTWSWPSPSVQLSAAPTNLPVGAKTNLSGVGVNLPPGAKLVIKNTSTGTILGTYTAQDFTRSEVLDETDSKATAQTDQYVAQVVSGSGQVLTQSAPVRVTWTDASGVSTSPLNLVLHATGIPQYIKQGSRYVQKFDVSNDGSVPVNTVLQFVYQGMKSQQVQDGDIQVWENTPVVTTTNYPVVLGAHDATELSVTVPAGTEYISTGLGTNGNPIWQQDPNYAIHWTANVNPSHQPAETTYVDNILQISVPTNPAKQNAKEPVPYVISNPPGETMFGEKPFYNPNWVFQNGQWHYIGPGPADWVTGKAQFNPGN